MPYYELRTKLGMAGKSPDQIAAGVEAAYAQGESAAARWGQLRLHVVRADQILEEAGAWHPT